MGGCSFLNFKFSLVQFKLSRLRAFYRSEGLKSQLITLDNGSTMHCWVPKSEKEPKRSSKKERAQTGGPVKPPHQRPALVFIHGFGGNGLIGWDHQIAAFTKEYRVFVPDLLFFGMSTTDSVQRTEIFQADCVMKMLTQLDVQETHVVGASYGGFVAFWMAYKYPRLCWKVVISSSGICMNPRTNDEILRKCDLKSIEQILLPKTVDGKNLALRLMYVRPPILPDCILEEVLDIFYKEEDRQHRIELLNALVIGSEKCPPLPVLTQEVLILWGREDQFLKVSLANQLQEHLGKKQARLVIIEGAGHIPQVEKSKEYNATIRNFLYYSDNSESSTYDSS